MVTEKVVLDFLKPILGPAIDVPGCLKWEQSPYKYPVYTSTELFHYQETNYQRNYNHQITNERRKNAVFQHPACWFCSVVTWSVFDRMQSCNIGINFTFVHTALYTWDVYKPRYIPHIASVQFSVACYSLDGWMDRWFHLPLPLAQFKFWIEYKCDILFIVEVVNAAVPASGIELNPAKRGWRSLIVQAAAKLFTELNSLGDNYWFAGIVPVVSLSAT